MVWAIDPLGTGGAWCFPAGGLGRAGGQPCPRGPQRGRSGSSDTHRAEPSLSSSALRTPPACPWSSVSRCCLVTRCFRLLLLGPRLRGAATCVPPTHTHTPGWPPASAPPLCSDGSAGGCFSSAASGFSALWMAQPRPWPACLSPVSALVQVWPTHFSDPFPGPVLPAAPSRRPRDPPPGIWFRGSVVMTRRPDIFLLLFP